MAEQNARRRELWVGGVLVLLLGGLGAFYYNSQPGDAPAKLANDSAPASQPSVAPPVAQGTPVEVEAALVVEPEAAPEAQASAVTPPQILTWAVTPEGSATMAGLAAAKSEVFILLDGVEQAKTIATLGGEFAVVTEFPPNPNPSVLSVEMLTASGVRLASTGVLVVAPITGALVAQAEAATPASDSLTVEASTSSDELAQGGETAAKPATALAVSGVEIDATGTVAAHGLPSLDQSGLSADAVVIDLIAYDAQGNVQISGRGQGDADVRLYANDRFVQEAAIAADGAWQMVVSDLVAGAYTLRVDQLDAAGKVAARYETPFLREAIVAEAKAEPVDQSLTASSAVVAAAPARVTLTVQPGQSLWRIAHHQFGDGVLYVELYEANRDKIRNPDLIYPGQVFVVPAATAQAQ